MRFYSVVAESLKKGSSHGKRIWKYLVLFKKCTNDNENQTNCNWDISKCKQM